MTFEDYRKALRDDMDELETQAKNARDNESTIIYKGIALGLGRALNKSYKFEQEFNKRMREEIRNSITGRKDATEKGTEENNQGDKPIKPMGCQSD